MGCAASQPKPGSNTGESSESGFVASSTTSNRYVVSTEEDEGVATESDNTVHKNSDNNSDEMSMYTNISDFKAEKTKRKNRGGNDDGSQDIDADLNAFKNSRKFVGNATDNTLGSAELICRKSIFIFNTNMNCFHAPKYFLLRFIFLRNMKTITINNKVAKMKATANMAV